MSSENPKDYVSRQFLKHQHMLRDYISALIGDYMEAEDLVQEVGVKVLSMTKPPCAPEKFGAWCRGIARHQVLHQRRRERRRKGALYERFLKVAEAAYQEGEGEVELWNRPRRALDACLDHLPQNARRILEMRYVEGKASHEIGRQLGRSSAGVRMNLMRIRQSLMDCIEAHLLKETSS